MATYLITGIAGFIGSSLAHHLVQSGERVRGIDNLSTGNRENLAGIEGSISFYQEDLATSSRLEELCRGVDCIFHQAALASVPRSIEKPLASHTANVTGTLQLLIAARAAGVRRLVYAASSSAYGNTPTLPKHEAMAPDPISPYAVSKLAGEHYMTAFHRVYGLETVSLRYFNVFGPRQAADSPYSGVLAKFITQMLSGRSPTIFGDGEQSRDFTYVDNVIEANLLAAKAPAERAAGRVFNVALGSRYSLNETFRILQQLTGYSGSALYAPERAGDVKHSLADIGAAQAALGYRPKTSFQEGLRRTVDWYRSIGSSSGAGAAS